MKAIVLTEYGLPETLSLQERDAPTPSAGRVVVKIHAAGVNFLDIGKATGAFRSQFDLNFPWTPGIDFAGVITTIGENVQGFTRGDAVYGASLEGGAFADYILVDANYIALKPQSLTFIEAASVPVSAETAWQLLFQHGQLIKGKTVLVHGAAGAVGAYVVQLAHQAGAQVIVHAAAKNKAYLHRLGADQFVDDKRTPVESIVNGLDLVVDLVGKAVQEGSYQLIKPGGYLISTTQPPSVELASKFSVNALFFQLQPSQAGLTRIAGLIDGGQLKINLAAVYPLNEVATAWNDLLKKPALKPAKKNGRIVVQVA